MGKINFYKKQTVLNDIGKELKFIIANNEEINFYNNIFKDPLEDIPDNSKKLGVSNTSTYYTPTRQKNIIINRNHTLYPGIICTRKKCPWLDNYPLNVVDINKLSYNDAQIVLNAKKVHAHGSYEVIYVSDKFNSYNGTTYFYRIQGQKYTNKTGKSILETSPYYNINLKKQYQIFSVNNDVDNGNYLESDNYLNKLYKKYYKIYPDVIDRKTVIDNIKKFNNVEYSFDVSENRYDFGNIEKQNDEYYSYNILSNSNTILLNTTYNLLYYIQDDKINLMSYNIDIKDGFNYNNHMLYFDIDNNFIRSLNNTLYYDYNNIRHISKKSGIECINSDFFNVKNTYNNLIHSGLYINTNLKTDMFISLKKLKSLYNNCLTIYDTLSYYYNIDNYNNRYFNYKKLDFDKELTNNSYIEFKEPDIYFTDTKLGIYSLNVSYINTLYISNLNNISFKIGYNINYNNKRSDNYITSDNYSYLPNKISLNVDRNNYNIKLSYNNNYKYIVTKNIVDFIETSQVIYEDKVKIKRETITKNQYNKYILNTTYYLSISNLIDNNNFNKSGCTLEFTDSPYIETDNGEYKLILSNKHNINLRKINNNVSNFAKFKYRIINKSANVDEGITNLTYANNENIDLSKIIGNSYYFIISSENLYNFNKHTYLGENNNNYNTSYITLNKYLFDNLRSKNIIIPATNLYYYITNNYDTIECYPSLDIYPSKYVNSKFFKSEIFDENIYPIDEEIDTCISDIKSILPYSTNIISKKITRYLYVYEIKFDIDNNNYKLFFYKLTNNLLRYNQFANNNIKFEYSNYINE